MWNSIQTWNIGVFLWGVVVGVLLSISSISVKILWYTINWQKNPKKSIQIDEMPIDLDPLLMSKENLFILFHSLLVDIEIWINEVDFHNEDIQLIQRDEPILTEKILTKILHFYEYQFQRIAVSSEIEYKKQFSSEEFSISLKFQALQIILKRIVARFFFLGSGHKMELLNAVLKDFDSCYGGELFLDTRLVTALEDISPFGKIVLNKFFGGIISASDNKLYKNELYELFAHKFSSALFLESKSLIKAIINFKTILRDKLMPSQVEVEKFQQFACFRSLKEASSILRGKHHQESEDWLNNLLLKIFLECRGSISFSILLHEFFQKLISGIPAPPFCSSLVVREIDCGDTIPVFSNIQYIRLKNKNESLYLMDVKFDGKFAINIGTRMDISKSDFQINISVCLMKMDVKVRIFCPSPEKDKGFCWICFDEKPHLELHIENFTKSEHKQMLPHLTEYMMLEIQNLIDSKYLLPNWVRVSFPWHNIFDPTPTFNRIEFLLLKKKKSDLLKYGMENAGEVIGEIMGAAVGGAFTRAVAAKMGGKVAKYAASTISPTLQALSSPKNESKPPCSANSLTSPDSSIHKRSVTQKQSSHVSIEKLVSAAKVRTKKS